MPEWSSFAACSIISLAGMGGRDTRGIPATVPPSLQATSAGTINVAIRPGAVRAAAIASIASQLTWDAVQEVRTQVEHDRAMLSISEVRGVSWRK